MRKRKVTVIGGGFGGLAAAIRLQSSGNEVTLLEKRDRLGGRAYVYEQDGFTFDAGPTVITAPHCLEELFSLSGRKLSDYIELIPVKPLYDLRWEDGFRFNYTQDLDETLEQIRRKSPSDVQGYQEFLKYTEEVFHEGYTKLAHVPFLHWSTMVRVSPQLLKLKAYRSVYSILSTYLKDPQLRQAFSFHSLLVGGNPFETSSIYTLIHFLERKWGVFFPRGGTGALVQALAKLFTELGGEIQTNAEVERLVVEQGRIKAVETRGSGSLSTDAVVSNADVHHTYSKLLQGVPEARTMQRYLDKARYSMSLFVLYFGTNRRFDSASHHSILFGKRYKGLLKDIFKNGKVADDFSLYLHAPTVTDASLAPPGGEAFYVLAPVPHLGKSKMDWKEGGAAYAEKILDYLEARYLPGLKESIVTQRHFTPLDFKSELNAHLGSAFSLEPILRQSAYFRVHNRDPHVEGLYFVGAGTHPGAGVPGVVNSAKATAALMDEDFRVTQVPVSAKPASPMAATLEQSRQSIRVGSRSFALASRLFSKEQREAASLLYSWCRYCDDQVDETTNIRLQETRLERLRKNTQSVFEGHPQTDHQFIALSDLVRRYQIPPLYPMELLAGMEMDVRRDNYWTPEELSLYCYRVAGTVGLMMSHVMGVTDPKALKHACDLGIAMQLTNIARDVLDDFAKHRVYLPLAWLDSVAVPERDVSQERHREAVAEVVSRLLDLADKYYTSGRAGLKYLSPRCAFTVAAAGRIYQAIGTKVRRRGASAWDTRTVVPLWKKLYCIAAAVVDVAKTLPARWGRHRPKPSIPDLIWSHA